MNILSAQSQIPKIDMGTPQIVPPSASVSALMKFEEIPLNNYTGIPDISLPLINVPTLSKDLNVDISLKYHASSIAVSDIASDVGLGWSLFGGGTISRTIRGHADEVFQSDGSPEPGSVGIYHNTNISNHHNYYYDKIANLSQFAYNQPNEANQYYWDTVKRRKFDTEHDLWQFNFMEYTGRFYIKKNLQGILQIIPLSDYRLKIINHYATVNNNPYVPVGFTIYDEKGYRFEFDVKEISNGITQTQTTHATGSNTVPSVQKDYISAFQLSAVYDNNNNQILGLEYENQYKEGYSKVTYTKRYYNDAVLERDASCMGELPKEIIQNQTNVIQVRKLKTISINAKGKIYFDYTTGRNDTNINIGSEAPRLTGIRLVDKANNEIKKYSFTHDYSSSSLYTRMLLKKIELSQNGNYINKYELSYKSNLGLNGYKKDNWGYLAISDDEDCDYKHSESFNSFSLATTDALLGIKYPTGGAALFNFESNTYAYIGDQEITDFGKNHENLIKSQNLSYDFTADGSVLLPSVTTATTAIFRPSIVVPSDQIPPVHMMLQSYQNGGQFVESVPLICHSANCCIEINLDPNKGYKIKRTAFNSDYNDIDVVAIDFYKKANPQKKYLYGGGIRIKEIQYYESPVNIEYFDFTNLNFNPSPSRIKRYDYNEFSDPNKSSGALVHQAPIFETEGTVNLDTNCITQLGSYAATTSSAFYTEIKDFSEMPVLSTQGSHVGYKNVKVYETGNGYKEYVYTSPIDYPETDYNIGVPYIPSKNVDYKRGLLLGEKTYDSNNKILSEATNSYSFVDYEEISGHKFWQSSEYKGDIWNTYDNYLTSLNQYGLPFPVCFSVCNSKNYSSFPGYPISFTSIQQVLEAFGWAKLDSTQTKNYFYNNGITKILEKNESFEYNPLNKKISQHNSVNEDGANLKTKYFYHSGNSTYSQNRISEIEKIESYKDGKLLETKKINYNNNWSNNISFLPHEIQTSFGNGNLATEVTYDQYDPKGNLLQYTTKDGIPTAIIWGYNSTQPIAKITGVSYFDVNVSGLAADIIAASDGDIDTTTEQALISKLDIFRNAVHSLPRRDSQVSTYTYDPLIGVTSITPPSGIREVYLYDSANRLKEIKQQEKDATGNVIYKTVKEFKYNYKH